MGKSIAMDRKVPLLTKIAYGTTGISTMLSSVLVTTYAFFFYTEILLIPTAAATTITTVGRFWGWLVDPTMAVFIEKTNPGKLGKTRKLLIRFAIPGGLALFLTFAIPGVSTTLQIAWIAATYILQATLTPLLALARGTLLSRITTDRTQRTNMNQIYSILGTITSLTMTSETLNLVNTLGGGDTQRGFLLVSLIFGIIFAVCYLFLFFASKGMEPIETVSQTTAQPKGPGLKEILPALATNKIWMIALFITIFYTSFSMMQAQTMVSYFTYAMSDAQAALRIYSSASLVVTMCGYVILSFFTKRFGNAGTCMLGCILAMAGNLFRFVTHDETLLLYGIGLVISMFGVSLLSATTLLIVLDTGVYSEWKTGSKSDPLLIAGNNISSKIGFAVGGAVSGYLLAAFGYEASHGTPSEAVQTLFFYENTLFAAIGFALSAVCAFFVWRYEKKIPQMLADIQARKAQTN